MGCRPRWGEDGGFDAIITTRKGKKALGTDAVIMLSNYVIGNESLWNYVKRTRHYVAKHCDNPDIITHIVDDGMVNRYGYLFTKEPLEMNGKHIDVEAGWFTIKNCKTLREYVEYVDSFTKGE